MRLKNFKQYLNEEESILLEYTKYDVAELIAFGAIPLDPGMMDRLGFLEREQQAYHVTNSEYLEEMARNQKKKKQISCFTQGGPELARLPSQPNVLLLLEGTTVIKGKTDIWTLVSTRDRRWLDVREMAHSKASGKLRFLIQGVLSSVAKKIDFNVDVYSTPPKTLTGMILSLDKKDKISLYRLYLTEMEAMLNRSYKVLIDYLETAAEMKYNEVVLTKWKIQQAWTLESKQPAIQTLLETLKISYAGVMPRRDLGSLQL